MKKRPVKSTNRLVLKKKRRRTIDPATRQLILQILVGFGVLLFLVLCVTGVWYGSRVAALTITTITVEGGETISHTEVEAIAQAALEGSYLTLVPKRFAWTYPQETITAAVAGMSRVKNPVVERVSGTKVHITVDEYIPYALWCSEAAETNCLFVDSDGVAFAPAPHLEGGSLYRFISLGTEPAVPAVLRDAGALAHIVTVADALDVNFLLPVTKIELDSVGDVFFRVVGGGEIKVTLTQSPTTTLENLALVLSADEFTDIAPGAFQYIDLRFGSKVFVNDTVPTVATTIEETALAATDEEVSVLDDVVQQLTELTSASETPVATTTVTTSTPDTVTSSIDAITTPLTTEAVDTSDEPVPVVTNATTTASSGE